MPSRRERLLTILAEHPAGLAGENLLTQAGPAAERELLLRTLRRAEAAGEVTITGQAGSNCIASALIRPSNYELHDK
jgi:hypothetical protein